jgi:hypothetical protein
MSVFAELWQNITQRVFQSPRQLPSSVTIPNDHIDPTGQVEGAFRRGEHYFQVRINEMYLSAQRQWFSAIDPIVFVVSEFTYDRKDQAVPFLLGPAVMEKYGQKVPQGMMFRDTRVAGLHPYRGGRLSFSVVLCQLEVGNVARQMLRVIENAANALDFSTALSSYVKVAGVVMDGFEALLGLGGTTPLIGLRREFDPDAGDPFVPSFFALIDTAELDAQSLWVRNGQLMQGKSKTDATPYRSADFVLYSVVRPPDDKRSDLDTLPFYPLWERVAKEASVPKDDNWLSAKANMLSLYQTIALSPDLTQKQADELADEYATRMQTLYKNAVRFAKMGEQRGLETPDEMEMVRSKTVSILPA